MGEESDRSEDPAKPGCCLIWVGILVVSFIFVVVMMLVFGSDDCKDQFAEDTEREAQWTASSNAAPRR